MSDDERSGAEYAVEICAARDRLVAFAHECTPEFWQATPLSPGDPRSVGVIVDHVADAYGYISNWLRSMATGANPAVTGELVDELNAGHARQAAGATISDAVDHLRLAGDDIAALIGSFRPDQLDLESGRPRRLAQIAIRHADDHRSDLEKSRS